MLSKKNRTTTKMVEKVFKTGRFLNSPLFTFKYIVENTVQEPRISFIVPKSLAKTAVLRNRLRREGYRAIGPHLRILPNGIQGIFLYRKIPKDNEEARQQIETILNKFN